MNSRIAGKFRRITTSRLYLPEIDGIRFLCLSLVVLLHIHGYFIEKTTIKFIDNPNQYRWLNTFFNNGSRGVPLFFVLSGFIICIPFARHYIAGDKKPGLKQYYLRRLTRMEPPYFIAMTGIFLLRLLMGISAFSVLFPSWLASLIYSHNIIFHHKPLLTTVAWTLEVEIQFYIIAPFLFRILAFHKNIRRSLLCFLLVLFVVLQHLYHPPFTSIYGAMEYFLAGILLADCYVSGFAVEFFRKKWIPPFAPVIFLMIIYMPLHTQVASGILLPLLISLLFFIILRNDLVKKIFSYRFIPLIGGMCYSIYLTHYTVISIFGRLTTKLRLTDYYLSNLLLQVVLLVIPVLLIASVFYLCIERPFMSSKWLKTPETNTPAA